MKTNSRKGRGVSSYLLAAAVLVALAAMPARADVSSGALDAFDTDGHPLGTCPLKHTDVQAELSGFIARVTVTQQFENPYDQPIEATYVFPLSDRGAVDAMTMTIGDRTIHGRIDRREVARAVYDAAKASGKAASLLDQDRPNIFTQSVANIMPGERIDVTISYVEYLEYESAEYEFAFPMVVGPRYIPTDVTDASRISPPVTPKGTRAGHDISIRVHVDAGLPIRELASELHAITTTEKSDGTVSVELKKLREIPNRDFVLRYRVADDSIEDTVLAHAGEKGKFFSLVLQPPARVHPEAITPKEMIFVIDRSGSMSGFPIEKAKKAMREAIEGMHPNDTFNLMSFSGGLGYCFEKPVPNTAQNREKAIQYLKDLHGSGGTEMMAAIRAALERQDPERLRVVCFMTDGFIGNDMAILGAIQKNVQNARVFAFGIGNSVNRFLIENMGREGRGASEIVTLESDGDAAVKRFYERIRSPLLTDITVDFGSLDVHNVTPDPNALPDLFSAQPLILTGQYATPGVGYITIKGRTAEGQFARKVRVALPEQEEKHDVLASLWARHQIDDLMAKDWLGIQQGNPDEDLEDKITQLGLSYGLMTQFTSFVAVEDRVVNEGGTLMTVQVPVEMPDGVSYDGVFGAGGARLAEAAPSRHAPFYAQKAQMVAPGTAAPLVETEVAADTISRRLLNDGEPNRDEDLGNRNDRDPAKTPLEIPVSANAQRSKLDEALWNLDARLRLGSDLPDEITMVDGRVEVFIRLADDSARSLQALKDAGVIIVSHAQSSKTVYARVVPGDLETIAELIIVERIEPAKY